MNKLENSEIISAASCINNLENGDLNLVNDNVDG